MHSARYSLNPRTDRALGRPFRKGFGTGVQDKSRGSWLSGCLELSLQEQAGITQCLQFTATLKSLPSLPRHARRRTKLSLTIYRYINHLEKALCSHLLPLTERNYCFMQSKKMHCFAMEFELVHPNPPPHSNFLKVMMESGLLQKTGHLVGLITSTSFISVQA